jgi:hypothetical protein
VGGGSILRRHRSGRRLRRLLLRQYMKGGQHARHDRSGQEAAASEPRPFLQEGRTRPQRRLRVMIVEDETLIAMTVAQSVASCGYEVVGPFGKVSQA